MRLRLLGITIVVAVGVAVPVAGARALVATLTANPGVQSAAVAGRPQATGSAAAKLANVHSARVAGTTGTGAQGAGGGPSAFDVTVLPDSKNAGEPSLAVEPNGHLWVAAPRLPGARPPTAAWESSDFGLTWSSMISPATTGTNPNPVFGGDDADIAIDKAGNVYVASQWADPLAGLPLDQAIAYSSDKGVSWTANPVSLIDAVSDRPWLRYDPVSDSLYMLYSSIDGLRVAKASLRGKNPANNGDPTTSLAFTQNVVAVSADTTGNEKSLGCTQVGNYCNERYEVAPAGKLVIDPKGHLYFAFWRATDSTLKTYQMFVADSVDSQSWHITRVPGSDMPPPLQVYNYMADLVSDDVGNLYLAWAETTPEPGALTGREVFFATRRAGDSAWQTATQLTTRSLDGEYPAIGVVRPGVVDIAYLGTDNKIVGTVPSGGQSVPSLQYDLYLLKTGDAFADPPSFTEYDIYQNIDRVASGGRTAPGVTRNTSTGAPAFLDFFSITLNRQGLADLVVDIPTQTLPDGSHSGEYQIASLREKAGAPGMSSASGNVVNACPPQFPNCSLGQQAAYTPTPLPSSQPPAIFTPYPGNEVSVTVTTPAPTPSPTAYPHPDVGAASVRDPQVTATVSPGRALLVMGVMLVSIAGASILIRRRG